MSETFNFDEEEPKKQTGLVVLAGGLGLILLVMNAWPDGDDDEKSSTTAVAVSDTSYSPASQTESVEQRVSWPEIVFADVLKSNPFQMNKDLAEALGDTSTDAADQDQDNQADAETNNDDTGEQAPSPHLDPEKYPVRFIFRGPKGLAAMIGGKVYYQGDRIERMRIVGIEKTGVKLRPCLPETPSVK